jgi:hypothetical protein
LFNFFLKNKQSVSDLSLCLVDKIISQKGFLRLLADISRKENRPGLSASVHATVRAANTDIEIYRSSLGMQGPGTVEQDVAACRHCSSSLTEHHYPIRISLRIYAFVLILDQIDVRNSQTEIYFQTALAHTVNNYGVTTLSISIVSSLK